MPPKQTRLDRLVFLAFVVFGAYAAVFIHRTSFVVGDERYFSLFDDAMISMQYARNLAAGHGLVWNAGGERVEGISNPLWTLVMAAVHLLPLGPAKTGLVVQILGAALLLLNLVFVGRLALLVSGGSAVARLAAVGLTAFFYPVNYWGLFGTEFGILVLIITASTWKTLQGLQRGEFSAWPYLWLAAGVCVRLDLVVPFAGIVAYAAWFDRARRRRHLAVGGAALATVLIAQTALRLHYYGDWLPNTFYLNLTGYPIAWRMARGLAVFGDFVWQRKSILLVVPVLWLWFRRGTHLLLPLLLWLLEGAYSIYVGGDAWEREGGMNRYLTQVMPLLFVLLACGAAWTAAAVDARARRVRPAVLAGTVAAILVLLLLCDLNGVRGRRGFRTWLLLDRPYQVEQNELNVRIGLALGELTTPAARVALLWGGTVPYFSDRYAIDLLGKCDRTLARQPARVPSGWDGFRRFLPGHTKWDYCYSIGELQPDLVIGSVQDTASFDYLLARYQSVRLGQANAFLRHGSAAIRWDRVDGVVAALR